LFFLISSNVYSKFALQFMETQTVSSPELASASAPALDDLFVPQPSLAATDQRLGVSRVLDAGFVQRWLASPDALSYLPDTVFVGAWQLLQARWLGMAVPQPRDMPAPPCGTARAWLEQLDLHRRATQPATDTPLHLHLDVRPGHPASLHLNCAASLMDAPSAERLIAAIADTAADLLDRPDAALHDIRTLPEADRHDQLAAWNTTPSTLDRALTVPTLFSRRAAATPDAVALVEGDAAMHYGELNERTDRLAQRLQHLGVRAGDNVGLMLERSMAAIVAMLGILKAGAAYVPVPADFPPERVANMLGQAGATLVVTNEALVHLVPARCAVVLPDGPEDDTDHNPDRARREVSAIDGESSAYLMYTSGSTGIPKGMAISHRAILRLVVGVHYAEFAPGRAVLHAAPLAFDASTLEIWGPLLNGGRCVIHDERVPTGAGLARTIARHDVHTAWLTAALFNAVVDSDPQHLAGLAHLFTGGEALSVAHVRRALNALPGLALSNGYGPTECTTFAATHRIERASLVAGLRSVPLGRPIKDTVLRVLSPSLALLPSGLVGELCIGGHGLAHGYLRQPELTAARFVPDPFGGPGDRLYRTGDLARWLPDGTIEFIGRIDEQVKIHGHRIETGEVEAAILAHPAIQSCAVVARPGADGQLRLIAYLVARSQPLPWDVLRAHLSARLPAAMLPSAQVWLAQLPVTPNGKLDRKALPEPAGERPELAQPYEEPRDALEQQVCEAFARALCIDRAGRNDNFFDLGGNSLLVLQVLADLQRDDATPLSTNLFFRHPTPAAIAAQLQPVEETALRRPRRSASPHTAHRPMPPRPSPSSPPPAASPARATSSSSGTTWSPGATP
jgi:amino acid adenylation domain-containing protein